MKNFYLLALTLFLVTMNGFSQEKQESFIPYGKPSMKIYSNYNTTFSDRQTKKAFNLDKVYVGYEYFFSKNFSGKVNFEAVKQESGKMEIFVKNACMEYKANQFTVSFGLVTIPLFKIQEKYWNYRYLRKAFPYEYGFISSSDLGAIASYHFASWVNADFAVYNGKGYKKSAIGQYLQKCGWRHTFAC